MTNNYLLQITDLSVRFPASSGARSSGEVHAVNGVNLDLKAGEVLGIVGESGSGKSTLASAIMNLVPSPGKVTGGKIVFQGQEIHPSAANRHAVPTGIRMIFQDPMSSLDPYFTVESQLVEAIRAASPGRVSRKEAVRIGSEMLTRVGLDPETVLKRYSFELSGGQQQRIMIALSLLSRPALLIADEPTTALDVTIQDQILSLIRKLNRETGMAVLFVTHNLGIVADLCQRVIVMYGGEIMESASCEALFARPLHPYTQGLLKSLPKTEPYIPGLARKKLDSIGGPALDMANLPRGCVFADRCSLCTEKCKVEKPELKSYSEGHFCRCHLAAESDFAGLSDTVCDLEDQSAMEGGAGNE